MFNKLLPLIFEAGGIGLIFSDLFYKIRYLPRRMHTDRRSTIAMGLIVFSMFVIYSPVFTNFYLFHDDYRLAETDPGTCPKEWQSANYMNLGRMLASPTCLRDCRVYP